MRCIQVCANCILNVFLNNFTEKVTDPYANRDDLDFLLSYSSVKLKAKAV